jgi:hypothetical protein
MAKAQNSTNKKRLYQISSNWGMRKKKNKKIAIRVTHISTLLFSVLNIVFLD